MNELYMNINDYYRIIQQLLVNIYGHPGASVGKGKAPDVHGLVCKQDRIVRHHAMNECISRAVSAAVIPVRKGPAGMVQKDGKRPNGYIPWRGDCVDVNVIELEMWANAHRDGRPAEYT